MKQLVDQQRRIALPRLSSRWFFALYLGILALAVYLRIIGLSSRSLSVDEAYSYWFQQLSWHDLWKVTPSYETHPPFYYSILKIWCRIFGITESAMRSLSVLVSVLTISVVALWPRFVEKRLEWEWVGLGTALLLACNAGSVQYAQQARPYALLTLVVTLMMLTSVSLLGDLFSATDGRALERKVIPKVVCLGVFGGLTLWFHNTSVFTILANWTGLGFAVLSRSKAKRRDFCVVVIALLIALLVWAPCVPILLQETKTVASNFWPQIWAGMFFWPIALVTGGPYAMIPVCVVAAIGVRHVYRAEKAFVFYSVVALALPLLIVFVLSYLFRPILLPRIFLWMGPGILLLACYGIKNDASKMISKGLAFTLLLTLSVYQTAMFYPSQQQNYKMLFPTLLSRVAPNDIVLVYPNALDVGLKYYQRFASPRLAYTALPRAFPDLGDARPYLGGNRGEPQVVDADRQYIDQLIAGRNKVWLVGWSQGMLAVPDIVFDELKKQRGAPVNVMDFHDLAVTEFDTGSHH
ncbi:glycosyltransferase family 39 protein [Robbsia sp. KACC 23696]|uniref:glycosyltransferase family 39 protein n=1 Tax=Robbsia sp. KACC 23696 TaxID=3149231 RepID=UPI00325BB709